MTDKEQLDRVIDALGYKYHLHARSVEQFDDMPSKQRKLDLSVILNDAGLDWIKDDQRWNKVAERAARQAVRQKVNKGVFGDGGNE